MPIKEFWGSRLGFVLAAIGSAIGLGNIWRFGYIVYNNGGGAFLIPFFVALFTTGISLLILEFTLGKKFKGSAPNSLKKARNKFEWIGWWGVFNSFIIEVYYVAIISWALIYVFKSFTLDWGADSNSYFFGTVLKVSDSPWELGGVSTEVIIGVIVIWFLNWFILSKGVKRGIETANKIFMPLLVLISAVLVIRAITLPGAIDGIYWYLQPDFSRITNPEVWIAAYGQIFFSLGLGMGVMIAYASYLPEGSDIVANSVIVGLANTFFSLFIGLAVFGTLGYMSLTTGQDISSIVEEGIGLAFVVFPEAIRLMPALATLTGILFFSSLVIAGLSSSISLVESLTASIMDKFEMRRGTAVNIAVSFGLLGSLVFTTHAGIYWLDIIDHFINIYGIVFVGFLEAVAIGWFFNIEKVREWANKYSNIKSGHSWDVSVKIISPIVLMALIVLNIRRDLSHAYNGYPAGALAIGISVIIIGILLSVLMSLFQESRK